MTKKDYVLIASALARVKPEKVDERGQDQWTLCVKSIATALAHDNDRFDGGLFVAACEFDSE